MADITPIDTRYAGHRFRSRLEALWAVFFDYLSIPWEYEPQGYLVDGKPYLPDFLLYPETEHAFWFEVKGTFPTTEDLAKAQGLASSTGIRVCVYFAKPEAPAPDLSHITGWNFWAGDDQWQWSDRDGWFLYPSQAAEWQIGLTPTAFLLAPPFKGRVREPKSGFWWWTDCPFCGRVILKLHGQVGVCPSHHVGDWIDEGLYPRFAHRTKRLMAAYQAARSARFEHGECE